MKTILNIVVMMTMIGIFGSFIGKISIWMSILHHMVPALENQELLLGIAKGLAIGVLLFLFIHVKQIKSPLVLYIFAFALLLAYKSYFGFFRQVHSGNMWPAYDYMIIFYFSILIYLLFTYRAITIMREVAVLLTVLIANFTFFTYIFRHNM